MARSGKLRLNYKIKSVLKFLSIVPTRFKVLFAICLLLTMISSILEVTTISMSYFVIKILLEPDLLHAKMNTGIASIFSLNIFHSPLGLAYGFVSLVILSLICKFYSRTMFISFNSRLGSYIASSTLNSFISRDYIFHKNTNSADILYTIYHDASAFIYGIATPISVLISNAIILANVLVFGFIAFGLKFLLAFLFIATILIIPGALLLKMSKTTAIQIDYYGRLLVRKQIEAIHGIRDVLMLNLQKQIINTYAKDDLRFRLFSARYESLRLIPQSIISSLPAIVLSCSCVYYLVFLSGEGADSFFALLSTLFVILQRLNVVSNEILNSVTQISLNRVSARKIIDTLLASRYQLIDSTTAQVSLKTNRPDKSDIAPYAKTVSINRSAEQKLLLNQLSFCYGDKNIINSFSLSIKSGDFLGIAGSSGSGKSTLCDLILGLLIPASGTIKFQIDNSSSYLLSKDSSYESVCSWRRNFSYVPQDIYLRDASILSNICLDSKLDHQRMNKAIELSLLKTYVNDLPDGINTILGERGVRLSGGQRQRIALARMFYEPKPIIVLDEATSALDNLTEASILHNIHKHCINSIVICVAHRLTTLEDAHKIIVLNDGVITESGTFYELKNKQGSLLRRMIDSNIGNG